MSRGIQTTVHDVLSLPENRRVSVRWTSDEGVRSADTFPRGAGRDIDGANLWLLPALYDADAHMPYVPSGVRRSDLQRALAGGVQQMNVAVPWHMAREHLSEFAADSTRSPLPKIIPLLSVAPVAESADFAAWLKRHADELRSPFPRVCKLYSYDPNFDRNLDAVWAAGIKPMVWCAAEADLERLVERAKDQPLHLRHATSSAVVGTMKRARKATLQTSPHFLLPIAESKRESLTVLPPPTSLEQKLSLAEVFLDEVDFIASDHVAPPFMGPPTSPGLQTQQHFFCALLTLSDHYRWPLGRMLPKATTAPANVFGVAPPNGFILVDPTHTEVVSRWPGQAADRAPFEGLTMRGRVLAIATVERVEMV
jgi:dihydroorotase-like cyclic amidohydrolase